MLRYQNLNSDINIKVIFLGDFSRAIDFFINENLMAKLIFFAPSGQDIGSSGKIKLNSF